MTLAGDISIALTVSTMLTAFAAGLTARRHDAVYLLRHPRRFGRACFAINVAMPFCALWFADVFSLEPAAMSPLPALVPSGLRRRDVVASVGARLIAAVVWSSMLPLAEDGTIIAILALAAIGLFLGYVLGRSSNDRAVLAAGSTWRHPGVALTVASTAFHDNARAGAAVLVSVIVGTLTIRPFAWRRIQAPPTTALGTSRTHAM